MHIFVHLLDTVGVGAGVVGEGDGIVGAGADYAGLVVEMGQVDAYAAGGGDCVITGFPFMDGFPGTLGADGEHAFGVRFLHFVDNAHHHGLRILAIHGEGPEMSQNRPQRPEERLFLDHDLQPSAHRTVVEESHHEIVDAGMRGGQDNGFIVRDKAFSLGSFPAKDLIEYELMEALLH